MTKTILVRAYRTQDDFNERRGCDVEYDYATLKEARHRAKYFLTDDYKQSAEMSEPLTYSQVVVVTKAESWMQPKEEIHSDFFRPYKLAG